MKKESKVKKSAEVVKYAVAPVLSLLVVIGAFLFLTYSHTSNRLLSSFEKKYKIGDLVEENIYSPFSITFIDEAKTRDAENKAISAVSPLYVFSLKDTAENVKSIEGFFDSNKKVSPLLKELAMGVINSGIFSESELQRNYEYGYRQITVINNVDGETERKTIEIRDVVSDSTLEEHLASLMREASVFKDDDIMLLSSSISRLLSPNVHYDKAGTAYEREKALEGVTAIVTTIEKGDTLVFKDTIVTPETILLLENISRSSSSYNAVKRVVVIVFYIALYFGFFVLFYNILKGNKSRRLLYMNLLFALTGAFVAIVSVLYPYLSSFIGDLSYDLVIAEFFVPLVVLYISANKTLALSSVVFISSILGFLPFSGLYSVARYFFSGFLSVEFLYYTKDRIEHLVNYVMVFLIGLLISIVSLAATGFSFPTILKGSVISSVVFVVGQAIAVGTAVLIEKIFNLPTPYRLNELIERKTPLLERFEQACPGSYDHALTVEKLATSASDMLSLNTPLVRLASMYHDVGKMEHPLYFVENQRDENKHDSLNFELSASTIRSHVDLGVKLAKSAHLPKEVIDVIGQHHGNDTINYFYYEAQKQREEEGGLKQDVNEGDFAYNALPPQTKEAAIVMLSDISEAAIRSTKQAYTKKGELITEEVIRSVIHKLFMAKLEKNQLSESSLTIGELLRIEDLFVQKLLGENHSRIEYKKPAEDKNDNS